jgi:sulfur carrier protein ThiS adenylyltransferase
MQRATVGIAGLGGLGSNVAIALVRAAVGHLILVDFDRVERTNLNRQQYTLAQIGAPKTEALRDNLLAIDSSVDLVVHNTKLSADNISEVFAPAEIICECLDAAEQKAMLVQTFLKQLAPMHKKLVAVSGVAGYGPANEITTRVVSTNFALVGDGTTDVSAQPLLTASRVGVAASHQAHQVIRWLIGAD